jgi:hypothetical protein
MAFSRSENKGVARNLPPASLEMLPKPRFLPGFQRFREVFAELLGQRIEVISLPGSARRADSPARAAALTEWLFSLGLKAVCGGGGSDYSQVSVANGNHAIPGRSLRVGVTNDEAENPPRLKVTYGEDSKESKPPITYRVITHTAKT